MSTPQHAEMGECAGQYIAISRSEHKANLYWRVTTPYTRSDGHKNLRHQWVLLYPRLYLYENAK
jgi:hypothetical protein